MRSIRRTTVQVPTLYSREGKGYKVAKAHREQFHSGGFVVQTTGRARGSNTFSFSGHWREPDVRGALYAQQGWVCAYCGYSLTRGDRGDVEHFRPKKRVTEDPTHGGYWWLAYDFKNYVLSCSICNSGRKINKFPLRRRAWHVTYGRRRRLSREARLLPDPALDDMDALLRVDWRNIRCDIVPAPGLSSIRQAQAEKMIDFFRLNRDSKLTRERKRLRRTVMKLIEEGKPEEASAYAIRYRPHSLVAWQILSEEAPDHLPGVRAEVQWLFAELIELIDENMDNLELTPDDDALWDEREELLWSLAVLADDPPPGAPDLRARLTRLGLIDLVDEKIRELV